MIDVAEVAVTADMALAAAFAVLAATEVAPGSLDAAVASAAAKDVAEAADLVNSAEAPLVAKAMAYDAEAADAAAAWATAYVAGKLAKPVAGQPADNTDCSQWQLMIHCNYIAKQMYFASLSLCQCTFR